MGERKEVAGSVKYGEVKTEFKRRLGMWNARDMRKDGRKSDPYTGRAEESGG